MSEVIVSDYCGFLLVFTREVADFKLLEKMLAVFQGAWLLGPQKMKNEFFLCLSLSFPFCSFYSRANIFEIAFKYTDVNICIRHYMDQIKHVKSALEVGGHSAKLWG